MTNFNRTWAEIDLDKLSRNMMRIKSKLASASIIGVVKADAYGHGIEQIAREIDGFCEMFAVSNIFEATQLRAIIKHKPILILGYTPADATSILCNNSITQTVFSYSYAKELFTQAKKLGRKLKIHIKLDTGMSRLGFNLQTEELFAEAVSDVAAAYRDFSESLEFEGIFSHFAVSDDVRSDFTDKQFTLYSRFVKEAEERGVCFRIKHICNSAAVLNYPEMQLDMVRPGIIMYGLYPDKSCPDIGLESVLSLKTVVAQTRTLDESMTISYGRTYTAEKPMITATIPIGYADGYSRLLSNNGDVLINGKRAPIVGRVCMDQCMVDVTDIENVFTGTPVTLIGRDGDSEITASEIAEKTNTINYEVICLIGKRVPRVYIKGGKEVSRHLDISVNP